LGLNSENSLVPNPLGPSKGRPFQNSHIKGLSYGGLKPLSRDLD